MVNNIYCFSCANRGINSYFLPEGLSCENCIDGNKPLVAAAGPDQKLTLPADSILMDASNPVIRMK